MMTDLVAKGGTNSWRPVLCFMTCLGLALAASLSATSMPALNGELFPLPKELQANVEFWTKVYSEYDSSKSLLHDDRHLQIIYTVLDFGPLIEQDLSDYHFRRQKRKAIEQARAKYRSILQDSAAGRVSKQYPQDQSRIEAMFASVPGGRKKYSLAAGRLRTQTCLKDRFAEGIERSGLYMPMIERIFAERGLPIELTRLPFVESLFQTHARSSASAGGIWQFIPSTARLYMRVELEYDQRFDPHRATEAAASLLSKNYELLRAWPLAITAYNHGAGGMRRAVRMLGTRDMGKIATKYSSRTFGFASRNFYSEFLAAAQVYADRERLFPKTSPKPELIADIFTPDDYVSLRSLAHEAEIDLEELKRYNPALSSQVWAGNLFLPRGYPLLVPPDRKGTFEVAYATLPDDRKSRYQVGFRHRVRSGETLASISRKYGSSVRAVQHANKISNPNRIRIGQRLLIPPGRGVAPPRIAEAQPSALRVQKQSDQKQSEQKRAAATERPDVHVVRSGESLSQIAGRYDTSVRALQAANGLRSANRIHVGQRLKIPEGSSATHVVRRGETLTKIAQRYGTSVQELRSANNLKGSLIRPAQILVIPCAVC